jgi:hypothetical protein
MHTTSEDRLLLDVLDKLVGEMLPKLASTAAE